MPIKPTNYQNKLPSYLLTLMLVFILLGGLTIMVDIFIRASGPYAMAHAEELIEETDKELIEDILDKDPEQLSKEEVKEKLSLLSEQEGKIQEQLFQLSRKLTEKKAEKESLEQQIEELSAELEEIQSNIETERKAFNEIKGDVGGLLRSIQRMGPLSYLELLLESDSLAEFFSRLHTIRGILDQNRNQLDNLTSQKEELQQEKHRYSVQQDEKQDSKENLQQRTQEIKTSQEAQEELLSQVAHEREAFEQRMALLDTAWEQVEPELEQIMTSFQEILADPPFQEAMVELSGSFFRPTVEISEDVFQQVISHDDRLSNMEVQIGPEQIELELPDEEILIAFDLTLESSTSVKLNLIGGEFMGMNLPRSTLEEIIAEDELILDFEPLLSGYSISELDKGQGYIKLQLSL